MSGMATKFCILTTQRTGSSWISSLLDSHRGVKVYNEPFLYIAKRPLWKEATLPTFFDFNTRSRLPRPLTTFNYLAMMQAEAAEHAQSVGFKVMYNQIIQFPELLAAIILKRYKIIHLIRKNSLAVQLSVLRATQHGVFHTTDSADTLPLHIDPQLLIEKIKKCERKVSTFQKALSLLPVPVQEVYYEELVENSHDTFRRIGTFLAIPDLDTSVLKSDFKRVSQGTCKERIENYPQVANALATTPYAWMLQH